MSSQLLRAPAAMEGPARKFQRKLTRSLHVVDLDALGTHPCPMVTLDDRVLDLIVEFVPQRPLGDFTDLLYIAHSLPGRGADFIGVSCHLGHSRPCAQHLRLRPSRDGTVLHVDLRHLTDNKACFVDVDFKSGHLRERGHGLSEVLTEKRGRLLLKRVQSLLRTGILVGGGSVKIMVPSAGNLPQTCRAMTALRARPARACALPEKSLTRVGRRALDVAVSNMSEKAIEEIVSVANEACPGAVIVIYGQHVNFVRLDVEPFSSSQQRGLLRCARRLAPLRSCGVFQREVLQRAIELRSLSTASHAVSP